MRVGPFIIARRYTYAASAEAFGAERAVSMAICGEAWRPFDVREDAEVVLLGAASL